MCLAKCLKFPEFEAGCAYKLIAYKKKNVYGQFACSVRGCFVCGDSRESQREAAVLEPQEMSEIG